MCDNEIDLDEKEKKLLLLWKLRIEIYGMLCSSSLFFDVKGEPSIQFGFTRLKCYLEML